MRQMTERPRFLTLRREHGLTSEQVAKEAGLTLAEEYRAEIGSAVEPDVAYTLETMNRERHTGISVYQ
jgi:transcriptional regulator with XRE-family HTH domain